MAWLGLILFVVAWAAAILGGLGVGGVGTDTRRLDPDVPGDRRPWRSLQSPDTR